MRSFLSVSSLGLLFAFVPMLPLHAQRADPKLAGEVDAIRAAIGRNDLALYRYRWIEHTEVLVEGKLQSATNAACSYDNAGQVVKVPLGEQDEKDAGNVVSKRPLVRNRADKQDYIERALRMIAYYVPPNPQQLDAMLARGEASLERTQSGQAHIRFKNYHQDGDSMTFSYDPVSKLLSRVTVLSTLGTPKDPVKMEAVFEKLPDGVNHLASTTVTAKSRKIEVKTQNLSYKK
jgi:hypothetical protein